LKLWQAPSLRFKLPANEVNFYTVLVIEYPPLGTGELVTSIRKEEYRLLDTALPTVSRGESRLADSLNRMDA
jgi:hypothetical protein